MMAAPVPSNRVGTEFLEAMGLGAFTNRTREIRVVMKAGEVALVELVLFASDDDLATLRRYELVPAGEGPVRQTYAY